MTRVVHENESFEASAEVEKHLRRILGQHLEVTASGLRIVRVAGHLRLPGGETLLVRSRKASGTNLLTWATYGDPMFTSLRTLGALPEGSEEADFGALVARVFCRETWRAVQGTGLLRSYHRQQVRTATVRGRIDFARVGRSGGDLSRTPCVVFNRLPRTPLNCLLSAAISGVRRDPVLRRAAGAALPQLDALFAEVPPLVDSDLVEDRAPLSRLEAPFQGAVALARLILRSSGTTHGRTKPGTAFLFNLANLFESSVARAFKDSPLTALTKHPLQLYRSAQLAQHAVPGARMELDIFLPSTPVGPVVLDAKYKLGISSANIQQMVAYCWMTGARHGFFVVPEGCVADRRTYLVPAGHAQSRPVRIDIVELGLTGRSLSDWQNSGKRLVEAVRERLEA